MKITQLETLRLGEFPNLVWVRVHTDQGVVGLGETSYAAQSVEALPARICGAARDRPRPARRSRRLARSLTGYLGWRGSASRRAPRPPSTWRCGTCTARSVTSRSTRCSAAPAASEIRTYNTCAGYRYIRAAGGQNTRNWGLDGKSQGPYEDLEGFLHRADEVAHSLLEQGITGMKIWPFDPHAEASDGQYISGPDLEKALEPFRRIRKAVGNRMDIMVEFHSLWRLTAAQRIAQALAEFDTFWHEDPIRMDSLALLKQYAPHSKAPICASEILAGRWSFKDLLETGVAGIVMFDLAWCGGITEARRIAALADAWQLPVAPHDCTGPLVYAASVHFSIWAPNALVQESVRAFYTGWYNELVTHVPQPVTGLLREASGTGHWLRATT